MNHALRYRWRRAIALVINALWLAAGISLGLWPPWVGFGLYGSGLLGGAIALATGLMLTRIFLSARESEKIISLLLTVGLLQLFVFTGILTTILPPFYAAGGQPREPIPLSVEALLAAPPSLPAYVRLTGVPQPQLAVQDAYEVRGNRRLSQPPRTIRVHWVPLVPAGWQRTDAIAVMVERRALGTTVAARSTAVTGMLYPLQPAWGERFIPQDSTLALSSRGVGVSARWLNQAASFALDERRVYLLGAATPEQLRLPFIIVVAGFGTLYLGCLVGLSLRG